MGIFENGQNLLGNLKSSAVAESVRKFAPFVLAGTVGYAAADLTVLSVRDSLLPTSVPQTRNRSLVGGKKANIGTYSKIRTQNIFNADGEIPPPLSADESQDNAAPTNEAVLSQLPLTLQGTIVHFNPERSIATVRLNRKNSTQSFIPGEEIEGMAKVLTVERRKVIFTNLNTGIKEYIEIPEKAAFDFSVQAKSNPQPKGPVEEKGRNPPGGRVGDVARSPRDVDALKCRRCSEAPKAPSRSGAAQLKAGLNKRCSRCAPLQIKFIQDTVPHFVDLSNCVAHSYRPPRNVYVRFDTVLALQKSIRIQFNSRYPIWVFWIASYLRVFCLVCEVPCVLPGILLLK